MQNEQSNLTLVKNENPVSDSESKPEAIPETKKEKEVVRIAPEALPYSVVARIPDSEIAPLLQAEWEKIKDNLPPQLTKGFRKGKKKQGVTPQVVASRLKGGMAELYAPLLRDMVRKRLESNFDKEILVLGPIEYGVQPNGETSEHVLSAIFYAEPVVLLSDDAKELEITLPPSKKVDPLVESRLLKMQKDAITETPKPPEKDFVETGDLVVLDVNSRFPDGEIWLLGCLKATKMVADESGIQPKGLLEHVLGMKSGDKKDCLFELDSQFGELAGKPISASLRVRSVLKRTIPSLDDEFAKTKGCETLSALKEKIRKEVEDQIKTYREYQIVNSAMLALLPKAKMGPIPRMWVELKVDERVNEHVARTGKETLIKQYGSIANMRENMAFEAQRDLLQILVLKGWGKLMGMEFQEGESLTRLGPYIDRVQKKLIEIVKVKESTNA